MPVSLRALTLTFKEIPMKKNIILPLFLIAAAFTAFPAAAADKNVLFVFAFQPGPTAFEGRYNVSGILSGSGVAESTVSVDSNGVLTALKTIHFPAGDVYMTVTGPLNTDNYPKVTVSGQWSLTGGTRAYSAIRGGGDCVVVGDFAAGTFSGAYQGRINLMHGDE
jgi:hypothetical protein